MLDFIVRIEVRGSTKGGRATKLTLALLVLVGISVGYPSLYQLLQSLLLQPLP